MIEYNTKQGKEMMDCAECVISKRIMRGGVYQSHNSVLHAVVYILKMSYKTDYKMEGFFQYVVSPLERYLWQDRFLSATI